MLVVAVRDKSHLIVIHYTGENGSNMTDGVKAVTSNLSSVSYEEGVVKEEEISLDVNKDTVELLEYPEGMAKYKGYAAIERGRDKISERKYNVFNNNCESLINWIITDNNQTNQGDIATAGVGVGLAVGVVAAAGYGLYKALSSSKSDKMT